MNKKNHRLYKDLGKAYDQFKVAKDKLEMNGVDTKLIATVIEYTMRQTRLSCIGELQDEYVLKTKGTSWDYKQGIHRCVDKLQEGFDGK